jgi:hypothetical protein
MIATQRVGPDRRKSELAMHQFTTSATPRPPWASPAGRAVPPAEPGRKPCGCNGSGQLYDWTDVGDVRASHRPGDRSEAEDAPPSSVDDALRSPLAQIPHLEIGLERGAINPLRSS